MDIGSKLKQARLEAGLSQRQLCGEIITRNMLSQIENGSARPSMDTLAQLAARLQKPIGYFLEETAVTSPNQQVMAEARKAWATEDGALVRKILEDYRRPDETFDWECGLLWELATLQQADRALKEGRRIYAAKLLQEHSGGPYCRLLQETRQLLMAQLDPTALLPDVDRVLLAQAAQALEKERPQRALELLSACETQDVKWHLLQGQAHFALADWQQAAEHFRQAEDAFPEIAIPRLEACYKTLEDYKMAYLYACKRRQDEK